MHFTDIVDVGIALSDLGGLAAEYVPLLDGLNRVERTKPNGMPKAELIQRYVQSLGGEVLSEASHPEFVKSIQDMASELKLPYKPMVAVVDRIPIGPLWAQWLPNAASLPEEGLVFCTRSMMNLTNSSIHNAPSFGLKGWFAHELAHLKHDAVGALLSHYSTLLFPAAAMVGLFIYNKALAKTPENAPNYAERFQHNIHQGANNEQARLDEEEKKHSPDKPWRIEAAAHRPLIEAGKYLAAGVAGLIGAYAFRQHASLSREFRADRIAVELTKAPEAFKQALMDMERAYGDATKRIISDPKALEAIMPKTMKEYFDLGKLWLDINTTHAHPTFPERLAHIEKIAANMAAKGVPLSNPT